MGKTKLARVTTVSTDALLIRSIRLVLITDWLDCKDVGIFGTKCVFRLGELLMVDERR
jgi:hypothetical protein